ncbi:hypothetical protein IAE35_01760 [Pseudomonas sp. S75]|uniref:RHS repeat-associated core domain-containing protein n=1 Tax=unclassified Pseudomonas TaxID=196821 RepID=UPI001907AAF5|nr:MULTISPECIES: RHS repeat-associated core domain-containing protein [unclassified Pseudomonas]MBJ9974019.1 hypothetical protein [Pseudomonas sp. S30]MBK0152051.1 hypothetical protein [Pseudomonas sp. S75]
MATERALEPSVSSSPAWHRCQSAIPLNDKWSKAVRTFDVRDGRTGEPLPGSPLSFIFGDDDTKDKWPARVRAELAASGLDAYLRLGTEDEVDGDIDGQATVDFWQVDKPLRVSISGFEETDKAAKWSCALHSATGAEATLAQALQAFVQPPKGGVGQRRVRFTLRDKNSANVLQQWDCELDYTATGDPLQQVDDLASSIEANIQVKHTVHDLGKALTVKTDKSNWTLSLPHALQLELGLSQVASSEDETQTEWIACHAGIPLNDKWSKAVRVLQVNDETTGVPVPGSPLSFSFGDDSTQDKWPTLVRAKLKASGLDAYLRLGTRSAVDGDIAGEGTVDFWHVNTPLRIVLGGFEETDKATPWNSALRTADGKEATLAQMLDAYVPPPEGGAGKKSVPLALRDKKTGAVLKQWQCELTFAADNLLERIDALAKSIKANIGVTHAIHDIGKSQKSTTDKASWTLQLPQVLQLELTMQPEWQATAVQMKHFQVPYLITTQPDGYLPDMRGFSLERLGSIEGGWHSSSSIKAVRDLKKKEVLRAYTIDRLTGDISCVEYKSGELEKEKWPHTFTQLISQQSELMVPRMSRVGGATELRLWSPVRYRAFHTAPFAGNIVQALAINDSFDPSGRAILCVQVRDLTTQALYEQHMLEPQRLYDLMRASGDGSPTSWSKALSCLINQKSQLLRAGVLDKDCDVIPNVSGNALWVPQCAELSVTLTEVHWWQSQPIEVGVELPEQQALQAWVYDAFSHRLMAHHEWTPDSTQRLANGWATAWAQALDVSPISRYLQAKAIAPGAASSKDADEWVLRQLGDGLRIFTTLPGPTNRVSGPLLDSAWKAVEDAVLVTLRHPNGKLLHHSLFKPDTPSEPLTHDAWIQALASFITAQAWPEVQIDAAAGASYLPRYSELELALTNVGAGTSWQDSDYAKYLTGFDDLPASAQTAKAEFAVKAGDVPEALQVTVKALNGELIFLLGDAARAKGYRISACIPRGSEHRHWPVDVTDTQVTWAGPIENSLYDLYLDYPESARDSTALTVGEIGACHPSNFWYSAQNVQFTPPAAIEPYEQISFLCEDYGNTSHSEVFDTSNQDQTGVDHRSGLFHAHYAIATLQGIRGLGPVCDLSLHYSALRGNEAGLGDGWAWRFSKLITSAIQADDHRVLTLADGTMVRFSQDQWAQLGEGQALKLETCRVSCDKDYSTFVVEFPSGRQEVLSKPASAGSDEIEPNDEFRKKLLAALLAIKNKSAPEFPTFPEKWQHWVLWGLAPAGYYGAAAIDYAEAVKAWEGNDNLKELDKRIAHYQRPFVQLLPSRIVSQYGEALDLEWKRQNGQFLLKNIKSDGHTLFAADYVKPQEKTGSQVNMQVWPGTDEAFDVQLILKDYLLRTLKRLHGTAVVQQVECGYDDDPTLDRVLCRLQELDGSVECVQYLHNSARLNHDAPSLPRVALHALLPGDGQQNQIEHYAYTGSYQHSDDQLFIAAVHHGAHGSIAHDTHVYGLDANGDRVTLLQGSGTAEGHWLEFVSRSERAVSQYRYTGWGDELDGVINRIIVKPTGDGVEVSADTSGVDYQQAVLALVWQYSTRNRKLISSAIASMLSLAPKVAREDLGKTVQVTTRVMDEHGKVLRLRASGEHSIHYSYYTSGTTNQIVPGSVTQLSTLPTLECPALPDHAAAPLMAEYQCDDHGNAQGLKLYGYRIVNRAGRDYLELAELVIIEGLQGALTDDSLDEHTTWSLAGDEVLWHQISTTTTGITSKPTPSQDSKVKVWSISSKQTTHHNDECIELETIQAFEDNPNQPGIWVRVTARTTAGTAQVSKTLRSRHSRAALVEVENDVETHWRRDAVGRVTEQTRYTLAPGHTGRAAKQAPDERIGSAYSADGKQVVRTFLNGDQSRSHLDGLKRIWRNEWRRAGTSVYVPMDEYCFKGIDDASVIGSWSWDYLPGGQAVCNDSSLRRQVAGQPWLSVETGAGEAALEHGRAQGALTLKLARTAVTSESSEAESGVAQRILDIFAGIDANQPKKRVSWESSVYYSLSDEGSDANTIGLTYLKIRNLQSDLDYDEILNADPYVLGEKTAIDKFSIIDELKLIKTIQRLAGLNKLDGLENIHGPVLVNYPPIINEHTEYHGAEYTLQPPPLQKFKNLDDIEGVSVQDIFDLFEGLDESELKAMDGLKKFSSGTALSNDALATSLEDIDIDVIERRGLGEWCLSERTSRHTANTDGTFESTRQWADATGQQQMQVAQHYDADGRVIRYTRTVDGEVLNYQFERDILGRVTKVTRPDASIVEHRYPGFSTHIDELKVDGTCVATQTVNAPSILAKRKVGSREYGFAKDTVILPDKTRLTTRATSTGVHVQAQGDSLFSQSRQGDRTLIKAAADPAAGADTARDGWQHSLSNPRLPGCQRSTETTSRFTSQTADWQSLRGQSVASLRADGHWQRLFLDRDGRALRSCQDHEEVRYRYDRLGRLQARQVHALKGAGQWHVVSEHDGFDRETSRTFLHNGVACFSQHMDWRGDGRLASKTSYSQGQRLRCERFAYDKLDRLQSYTCEASDAAHCPTDNAGTAIKAQQFRWDALDNLVSCTSTPFTGDQVTQTFAFETQNDPTRMTSVEQDGQKTSLSWNSNGHLQVDGQQRTIDYTAVGQLSRVKDASGALLARYEYDGLQRLAAQHSGNDGTTHVLRYHGANLIGEVCLDKAGQVARHTSLSPGLAQYDDDQVRWLIDDPQSGVAGQVRDGALELAPLLPFGEGVVLDGLIAGYNGMRRDPVTGHYHAGNGYRSYDPTLRRYAQPDWLSPFGQGGLNDYAHCPDPVNLHDPSGAIMLSRWGQDRELATYARALQDTKPMPVGSRWRGLALSLVLTIVGIAGGVLTGGTSTILVFTAMTLLALASFTLEVAAVLTEDSDPRLSKALGIASLVAGVASLAQSAWGLIKETSKAIRVGLRSLRQIGKLRQTRRIAQAASYAMNEMGEISIHGFDATAIYAAQEVTKSARGWGAKLMAGGNKLMPGGKWMLNYLNVDAVRLVNVADYSRAGFYGKALLRGHRINNYVARSSRWLTAGSWFTGKLIETYIVHGAVMSVIALVKGDSSTPVGVWGREYTPRDYQLNYGSGGHRLD